MKIYPVNRLPDVIILGRQTEYGVNEIRIDCAPWLAVWPGMQISVWVTSPNGDGAYPASIRAEGDLVVWEIGAADTNAAGAGYVEIMGLAEGKKKLSATAATKVLGTTTGTTTEPPEAHRAWVEEVARNAMRAEEAAQKAEESAEAVKKDLSKKLDKGGHAPNKYLGTDSDGNVVAKDAPSGGGGITGDYVSSVNGQTGKVELPIPSKTSEITNDSGFVTNIVNDLVNYYLKSETYTREEINQRISAIPKFTISVVSALPASGDETTIYLVGGGVEGDLYTEYIYANGEWEILGSQRVDLTGYATETWVIGQLAGYQPKGDYALKNELPEKLLQGDTKTVTPSQVAIALINDRNVLVAHETQEYGPLLFTSFALNEGKEIAASVLTQVDGVFGAAILSGDFASDTWFFQAVPIAKATDIPPVPVQSVNGQTGAVKLKASDVEADPAGTAAAFVAAHNTHHDAHNDIRLALQQLAERINAALDSDDATLDELSEIVAYIKSNKTLIDAITTSKVSVSDIINNLTTNVVNKPLSAAQGVALKALIDAITVPTKLSQLNDDVGYLTEHQDISGKLDANKLPEAVNEALAQAAASGEFDGKNGVSVTHSWNGTTLTVTSASGTSSANLKGDKGDKGDTGAPGADGKNGSDANVTTENITSALGYTPADAEDIRQLTEEIGDISVPTKVSALENDAGYVTEDKLVETVATDEYKEAVAELVPIVKVVDKPEFVGSIEDMTDQSKPYVLTTDGMIYTYGETEKTVVTEAQNRFDPSKASISARLSGSSGTASGTSSLGSFVTDFLPVPNYSSTKPFKVALNFEAVHANDNRFVLYNASKTRVGSANIITSQVVYPNCTIADGKTVIDIRKNENGADLNLTDVAYVRIQIFMKNDGSGGNASTALTSSEIANVTIKYQHESSTTTETVAGFFSTGIVYNQPADYEDRVIALETKTANNSADINVIKRQIANLESGEATTVIPEWWEDEVADTIAKIKALQVGRNCVTFPFFSDNHQRNGYAGVLIKRVMDDCHIPYCFFGGDSISSGYFGDETDAEMREQDAAFDAATAAIPAWQFCRAVGNHEYYWKVSSNETHYYTSDQVFEVFLRQDTLAQSKEFGGDTYYYVEDKASKVRWIVMDMNTLDDAEQIAWLEGTALSFTESGWAVVVIGHQPVTEHYATDIEGAEAARTVLKNYISGSTANKADVVGWWCGHIHRDRIFDGVAANPGYNGSTDPATDAANGDPIAEVLPWKTVSIISDNVSLGYGGVKHAIDNSDQSHAIDFVTINKSTRTVNLTRLGFGSDRVFTY